MFPEEDKRDKDRKGGGVEEEGEGGLCAAPPRLSSLLSDIMAYHQMIHH